MPLSLSSVILLFWPIHIVKYIEAIPGAKYEVAVDKHPALFSRRSHYIACKMPFDGREVDLRHEDTKKREDQ